MLQWLELLHTGAMRLLVFFHQLWSAPVGAGHLIEKREMSRSLLKNFIQYLFSAVPAMLRQNFCHWPEP